MMNPNKSGYSTSFVFGQVAGVAILVYLIFSMATNLSSNLQQLDIHLDMSFLKHESGFNITQKWLSHQSHSSNLNVLLVGMMNTIVVSAFGIVLSTIIAIVVALASYSRNPLLQVTAKLYISIFRNIPLLIQILFWYNLWILKLPSPQNSWSVGMIVINSRGVYLPMLACSTLEYGIGLSILLIEWGLLRYFQFRRIQGRAVKSYALMPRLMMLWLITGIGLFWVYDLIGAVKMPVLGRFNIQGWQIYPEFLGLWIGLSLYTAAYSAESMRGAIAAVPKGQQEACDGLNLSKWQAFLRVIVPQALPGMIPAMSSHYMNLTKNSSLGLSVGYPEMFAIFAGTVLNQTGRAIEIIAIIMAIYLVLSVAIVSIMNFINTRQAIWTGTQQN